MWTTIAFPFVAFSSIENYNSYHLLIFLIFQILFMSISIIFIDIWVYAVVDIYLNVRGLYLGAFTTVFFVWI